MFKSVTKIGAGLFAATVMAGALPASAAVIGLWHFDGNMDDATGNSTATKGSQNTYDNDHQVGTQSLNVDAAWNNGGGVQKIDLGPDAMLNGEMKFGLAFWINNSVDAGPYHALIGSGDTSSNIHFNIQRAADHANYYVISNSGLGDWGPLWSQYMKIPDNEWTFIAITADGSNAKLYLNGTVVKSIVQTGALNMGTSLYLGGLWSYKNPMTAAKYDELILYKGDPGAAWASDLYQQGLAGHNTQVPEPASMSLLILGGVALLGRRKTAR